MSYSLRKSVGFLMKKKSLRAWVAWAEGEKKDVTKEKNTGSIIKTETTSTYSWERIVIHFGCHLFHIQPSFLHVFGVDLSIKGFTTAQVLDNNAELDSKFWTQTVC